MTQSESQNPPERSTHLPFSLYRRAGSLVFVSGQASVDENGKIVSDTFEAEFRRSMDNLEYVLGKAGCSLESVIQVRAYVRDPANVAEYNRLYREYFKDPMPARTTLTHCLPEVLHFEIECVAISDRSHDA